MKIKKIIEIINNNINSFNKNYNYYEFFIIMIIIIIIVYIFNKYVFINDIYNTIDTYHKIIYFGQTLDLENNQVSIDYSKGYQLAFQKINRTGGINGFKLKIILYNDKYEPKLASNNAKLLVDYYNVLALIGSFGTPTTVEILNECIKGRNIPLIAPYSAAEIYRKTFNKYLILMNGTFYNEFELMINHIIKNNKKNISIIYQNDIYGNAFYNSFVDYISKNNYNINIISTGTYERNTVELDDCFKSLCDVKNAYDYNEYYDSRKLNDMDATILFCAEKQISLILGHLKKIKPSLSIYYNFFVGTSPLHFSNLQPDNSENIYQTLLTPIDFKEKYPKIYGTLTTEINEYNKYNNDQITNYNQSLFQGYITGLLIGQVLQKSENIYNLDRKQFIDLFYKIKNFNIYNFKVGPFIEEKSNLGINYASLNKVFNNKLVTIQEKYF
jgi:hypothetical protein